MDVLQLTLKPPTTTKLSATSHGWEVLSLLESCKKHDRLGRVHSVFRRAVNISFFDDNIVSLVDVGIGRGPFNVVLVGQKVQGATLPLDEFVKQGDSAVFSKEDSLVIGASLEVELQSSQVYTSRHNFADELLPISEIARNIARLEKIVLRSVVDLPPSHFSRTLVEFLLQNPRAELPSNESEFFGKEIFARTKQLIHGVETNNLSQVKESASSLVGLGPGFTPAADDILTGFMLANQLFTENLKGDLERIHRYHQAICSFRDQTSFLSRAYLREAAVGNGSELAVSLMQQLLTNDKLRDLENIATKLLAVGATSGTSIAIGILLASKLAMKEATAGE